VRLAGSGLVIAGCLIAFGVWWNAIRDRITSDNSDRIQLGMTEGEVESILGRPADRQYHPWDISVGLAPAPGTDPEWEKMWVGQKKRQFPFFWIETESPQAVILVHFDVNGKVSKKGFSLVSD